MHHMYPTGKHWSAFYFTIVPEMDSASENCGEFYFSIITQMDPNNENCYAFYLE